MGSRTHIGDGAIPPGLAVRAERAKIGVHRNPHQVKKRLGAGYLRQLLLSAKAVLKLKELWV